MAQFQLFRQQHESRFAFFDENMDRTSSGKKSTGKAISTELSPLKFSLTILLCGISFLFLVLLSSFVLEILGFELGWSQGNWEIKISQWVKFSSATGRCKEPSSIFLPSQDIDVFRRSCSKIQRFGMHFRCRRCLRLRIETCAECRPLLFFLVPEILNFL